MNELGELDIAAQIDYIHMVKTDELREIYGEGTASVEDLPPSTLPYDSLGDGYGLRTPCSCKLSKHRSVAKRMRPELGDHLRLR